MWAGIELISTRERNQLEMARVPEPYHCSSQFVRSANIFKTVYLPDAVHIVVALEGALSKLI